MRKKLTKTVIGSLKPGQTVMDTIKPYLGARCQRGIPVFVLSYRRPDGTRVRNRSIGRCDEIAIEQARDLAEERFTADKYGVHTRSRVRRKAPDEPTFEAVCSRYIHDFARHERKTWRTDQGRIERHLLPKYGQRGVSTITRSDVMEIRRVIGTQDCKREHCRARQATCDGHPIEANRVRQLLHRIFEFARDHEIVDEDHRNPAAGVPNFDEVPKTQRGDRAADEGEVRRLLPAVWRIQNRLVRGAVWLTLLGGFRKSEVLGLRWDHVNLTKTTRRLEGRRRLPPRSVYLPDPKNGEPAVVPLSTAAAEVLRSIHQTESPYVFPSKRSKTGHLVSIDRQWRGARDRAGVPELTLHDLRATAGTWASHRGVHDRLVTEILHQKPPSGVLSRYVDASEARVREEIEATARQVLDAAGVSSGAHLVDPPDDKANVIALTV